MHAKFVVYHFSKNIYVNRCFFSFRRIHKAQLKTFVDYTHMHDKICSYRHLSRKELHSYCNAVIVKMLHTLCSMYVGLEKIHQIYIDTLYVWCYTAYHNTRFHVIKISSIRNSISQQHQTQIDISDMHCMYHVEYYMRKTLETPSR